MLQKVHIISNVHLNGVPYEELISLSQICCCAWRNKEIDKKENTRTVLLVLLDEASAQLNSREFKTNINADFLNSLITSRHFNMSIFTLRKSSSWLMHFSDQSPSALYCAGSVGGLWFSFIMMRMRSNTQLIPCLSNHTAVPGSTSRIRIITAMIRLPR